MAKHNKSKGEIRLSTITLLVGSIAIFFAGIFLNQYQHRNDEEPNTIIIRDDQSQMLWQYWTTSILANRNLVAHTNSVVAGYEDLLHDFESRYNGGRPLDQDRREDLANQESKRTTITEEMFKQQEQYRAYEEDQKKRQELLNK